MGLFADLVMVSNNRGVRKQMLPKLAPDICNTPPPTLSSTRSSTTTQMSHIGPLCTMTKEKTQKDRNTQVRKRTKGLIKKAHQLAVLTGVYAAVAVEDPVAKSLRTYRSTKRKSFPPTPEQVVV
jgi:hypothetical protein